MILPILCVDSTDLSVLGDLGVSPFEMMDGVGSPADFGSRPWFGFPFSFRGKDGGPKGVFEREGGGRQCGVAWDGELVWW